MNKAESTGGAIAAESVMAVRRSLERADFLLELVEGVCDDDGPWARLHVLALLDAGLEALREAIDEVDRLLEPS
jgi:hypothetical protein